MTTRALRVEVTAIHIARGKPQRPCSCPVALAIEEAAARSEDGPLSNLVIGHWSVRADGWRGELPPVAVAFIVRFDDQESTEPFGFDLELQGS